MLYPYIIYLVLEYTYSKTNYASQYKDRKRNTVMNTISLIVTGLIIALISCQFKWGILVIGSGSMTGTIDKGDIVVYESYKNKEKINFFKACVFDIFFQVCYNVKKEKDKLLRAPHSLQNCSEYEQRIHVKEKVAQAAVHEHVCDKLVRCEIFAPEIVQSEQDVHDRFPVSAVVTYLWEIKGLEV